MKRESEPLRTGYAILEKSNSETRDCLLVEFRTRVADFPGCVAHFSTLSENPNSYLHEGNPVRFQARVADFPRRVADFFWQS